MNIIPGTILASSALMDDPAFYDSVVLIVEYNKDGALGFVVNKVFEHSLNELVEFSSSPAFPLHSGGPVDKEHLYFIHQRNDLIAGGTFITGNIYFGGNFKQAISCINNNHLTTADIKIFIGYCGWDADDLENEIAEGSWEIADPAKYEVFS